MDSSSTDITDVNVSFVASPLVKKRQDPEQMSLWLVKLLVSKLFKCFVSMAYMRR